MTADAPDLTVAELEQIRDATLRTYEGGDEQYNTLPPHLLNVVDGDGGLVNMIDLAISRTRQLEALRAQVQQDYAAIHAKQQRDQARIAELETALSGVVEHHEAFLTRLSASDYITFVPPGVLEQMLDPDTENGPSPRFREAIARARQRREEPNG